MAGYTTPGVYFEWQDSESRIEPARSDVAGFIGIAERGPLHQAIRLQNWAQFNAFFGEMIAQGYLAYAVQGFFANGGRTCYVVRIADPVFAKRAQIDLCEPIHNTRLRLTASSEGEWAHQMTISVLFISAGRFTLTLTLPSGQREVFRDLSLDEKDARFAVSILSPWRTIISCGALVGDRPFDAQDGSGLVNACLLDANEPPAAAVLVLDAPQRVGRMLEGADGLWSLRPEHFNSDLGADQKEWGLAVLKKIPEVAIVAIPDILPPRDLPPIPPPPQVDCTIPDAPPGPPPPQPDADIPPAFSPDQIQALELSLIIHCEQLKDRMALLNARLDEPLPQDVIAHRNQFDSSYAAFYFPWLRVVDPLELNGLLRSVPPCGHVAGIYARSELNRGVHKPPANEVVETGQDVTIDVDDITHGLFNDAHVNVLRTSAGRGLRVMGARTVSSDPMWLFLNVRRLLINIERGIQASSQWLPFEPNNPELWREVDRVLRTYLTGLYRRGMLDGNSPDEAFFVDCSLASNPPSVTDQGQLIAMIGVRPPPPAEFIIVRIGRTESGLDFVEQ